MKGIIPKTSLLHERSLKDLRTACSDIRREKNPIAVVLEDRCYDIDGGAWFDANRVLLTFKRSFEYFIGDFMMVVWQVTSVELRHATIPPSIELKRHHSHTLPITSELTKEGGLSQNGNSG